MILDWISYFVLAYTLILFLAISVNNIWDYCCRRKLTLIVAEDEERRRIRSIRQPKVNWQKEGF